MSDLVAIIQKKANYHGKTGATKQQIDFAQQKLGMSFSPDYKEYISSIGVASFDGHELTGIISSPRLDVVSVTEKNRRLYPNINPNWYVLEEINLDDIVVWQDEDGCIYSISPNQNPVMIAHGIIEYINL